MENLYDLIRNFENELYQLIESDQFKRVGTEEVGLDRRAGHIYVGRDCLVSIGEIGMLEYYGGFEYIDKQDRQTFGRFNIWYDTSDRVQDCLDYFNGELDDA